MDTAIVDFLAERKAKRIKEKTNSRMSDEEVQKFEATVNHAFAPENWLPDAAKRASQIYLVSHPAKFSHPNAHASTVVAKAKKSMDGFLRSGNVDNILDVFGNAAAMDVYKFLSLILSDGKTLLEHLEANSQKIKEDLTVKTMSYDELRRSFLAIKKEQEETVTDKAIKQVYFPVEDAYHLLSILTPSGLLFELKRRILEMVAAEKSAKHKKDESDDVSNEDHFKKLYNLTLIGFGGSKPQNISVLNSAYHGKAYMLPCLPPQINKRNITLPKNNFIADVLNYMPIKQEFYHLHSLYMQQNNVKTRHQITACIQEIVDYVINKSWEVRLQGSAWTERDNYKQLPKHQKIWLDDLHRETRHNSDSWLKKLLHDFAIELVNAYEKHLGKQALKHGDENLVLFRKIIKNNSEGFR